MTRSNRYHCPRGEDNRVSSFPLEWDSLRSTKPPLESRGETLRIVASKDRDKSIRIDRTTHLVECVPSREPAPVRWIRKSLARARTRITAMYHRAELIRSEQMLAAMIYDRRRSRSRSFPPPSLPEAPPRHDSYFCFKRTHLRRRDVKNWLARACG